jgi:hypothetical protein
MIYENEGLQGDNNRSCSKNRNTTVVFIFFAAVLKFYGLLPRPGLLQLVCFHSLFEGQHANTNIMQRNRDYIN